MNIIHIARVCHETNRAYCKTIGDDSQVPWRNAPDWQRKSAVKGVCMHLHDLRHGVPLRPEASHEGWLNEKLQDGWTYGETKDPEKKTHPCCVPFDQLPAEQKMKDFLFCNIVEAFWKMENEVNKERIEHDK